MSDPHGMIDAMTTLNWRTVRSVQLKDKLIPNPNAENDLKASLTGVRVALEGSFVHIDPRQAGSPDPNPQDTEIPVYIVPATAVERIDYRAPKNEDPTANVW